MTRVAFVQLKKTEIVEKSEKVKFNTMESK